jgi:hypothetical protein
MNSIAEPTKEPVAHSKNEAHLQDGNTVKVTKFRDVDAAYEFVAYCRTPVSIVVGDFEDPYGNIWVCDSNTAVKLVRSGYSYCSLDDSFSLYQTPEQFHTTKWVSRLPDLIHREFVLIKDEIIKVQKFNNPHSCFGFIRAKKTPVSIILGNPGDPYGAFWICDPADGFKLVEEGYEFYKAEEF